MRTLTRVPLSAMTLVARPLTTTTITATTWGEKDDGAKLKARRSVTWRAAAERALETAYERQVRELGAPLDDL